MERRAASSTFVSARMIYDRSGCQTSQSPGGRADLDYPTDPHPAKECR